MDPKRKLTNLSSGSISVHVFAKTKPVLAVTSGVVLAAFLFMLNKVVGASLPQGLLF